MKKLAERDNRRESKFLVTLPEPGNFDPMIVYRGIEKCSAGPRKNGLQLPDMVDVKAEYGEPILKTIVRKFTEAKTW